VEPFFLLRAILADILFFFSFPDLFLYTFPSTIGLFAADKRMIEETFKVVSPFFPPVLSAPSPFSPPFPSLEIPLFSSPFFGDVSLSPFFLV